MIFDITEFLKFFDAFMIGGDAFNTGQLHNDFATDPYRIIAPIVNPKMNKGEINADMPYAHPFIFYQFYVYSMPS